ncbi:MAG: MMPL family transporter [Pseudomonadota bacterium]
MAEKDKLDLSNPNFLDIVVDYRRWFVVTVAVITVILAYSVPKLETDPSLKSGVDTTSEAYRLYERYLQDFGNEEFILVVMKPGTDIAGGLNALEKLTNAVEKMGSVAEVLSPTNLKMFQKKGGLFGSYPIIMRTDGSPSLLDRADLARMKKGFPLLDLLISDHGTAFGVLVRIDERYKFDQEVNKTIIHDIERLVMEASPPGTELRIVGAPLIRRAIVRYNIQTGVIFGCLCMLIGTVVSLYVFKSIKVTAITNAILSICVLWVLGWMAVLGIPLNSTTALSFGFIPITTLEIVIHMVVRYHQFHKTSREKTAALKQTVRWLARPCLICSATTAVGFGTLMVSSIPMVRQLGFIMSQGIIASYFLAMVLTPAFFMIMKSLDAPEESGMLRDWVDGFLGRIESAFFAYPRLFVGIGVALAVALFSGAPMIRSDTQILRMLSDKTPEIQDLAFVEKNLTPVNSLELMVELDTSLLAVPENWKKIKELEKSVRNVPEVVAVESLLSLLEYLDAVMEEQSDRPPDIFRNPGLLSQLLMVTSLSGDGERVKRRFLNEAGDRLRISVRIKNSPTVPIGTTIEHIRSAADTAIHGLGRAWVTGEIAVVENQTSGLIDDQIKSMFLAAALITVIMMIQMGSPLLGFICLIPNIPPVAAVFGIMGWFGIPLDSVTVFAATVAIGLAVDNTIHFLTQIKREIALNPGKDMGYFVSTAYRLTAKQILSWCVVTMLGFLALAVSPFRPVVFFGILGCSSLLLGLYGDLIFIQSLILTSSAVRNTIRTLSEKHANP